MAEALPETHGRRTTRNQFVRPHRQVPSEHFYDDVISRSCSETSAEARILEPFRRPPPPVYAVDDRLLQPIENPFLNGDNISATSSTRSRNKIFSSFTSLNLFRNGDIFLTDKHKRCKLFCFVRYFLPRG